MWRYSMCSLALLLWIAARSHAATISTNSIISAENSYSNETVQIISGASPPTVVNLIDGGEAGGVLVDADSIFNMQGGKVAGSVTTRHNSRANILGGSIDRLNVQFDSVANLYSGRVMSEVRLSGNQGAPTLNMSGGRVEGDVTLAGASRFHLHEGSIGHVFGLATGYIANITGGSFLHWSLRGTGVGHWSGGESLRHELFVYDDSVLHIYGSGWKLDYEDHYSGTLLDGTQLNNFWFDTTGNGKVILHEVPEPGTLALALTACFACWAGLSRHGRTV